MRVISVQFHTLTCQQEECTGLAACPAWRILAVSASFNQSTFYVCSQQGGVWPENKTQQYKSVGRFIQTPIPLKYLYVEHSIQRKFWGQNSCPYHLRFDQTLACWCGTACSYLFYPPTPHQIKSTHTHKSTSLPPPKHLHKNQWYHSSAVKNGMLKWSRRKCRGLYLTLIIQYAYLVIRNLLLCLNFCCCWDLILRGNCVWWHRFF